MIDKSKYVLSEKKQNQLNREVKIIQNLDHPNIAKCIESYVGTKKMYICMELCGSSLSEIVEAKGLIQEQEAAGYIL